MKDGNAAAPEQAEMRGRQSVQFHGGNGDDGAPARNQWCDEKVPATVANLAAVLAAVAIAWLLLYVNVASELMAVPGGGLASIFVVYLSGTVAGRLTAKVGGLPPLLGMMVAGIVVRNAGLYTVTGWCEDLVAKLR